ncbi:MAG TPA: hypothetical protein VGM07_21755 [Stellaceae bacterium]|jgi:hypothetical protein
MTEIADAARAPTTAEAAFDELASEVAAELRERGAAWDGRRWFRLASGDFWSRKRVEERLILPELTAAPCDQRRTLTEAIFAEVLERLGFPAALDKWPSGMHFEDDPAALADQRGGFPRDLRGFAFGRLEVLARSEVPGFWRCRCSCGITKDVARDCLIYGSTRSCGCLKLGLGPLHRSAANLMGQCFGRLTVTGRARRSRGHNTAWRCRCACGHVADYRSDLLKAGRRTSCGCEEREARQADASEPQGRLRVGRVFKAVIGAVIGELAAAASPEPATNSTTLDDVRSADIPQPGPVETLRSVGKPQKKNGGRILHRG